MATAAGSLLLPSCSEPERVVEVVDGPQFFPQSVASGDPRPDSVVLWTRALNPASPKEPCHVQLQVASDPEFASTVYRSTSIAVSEDTDHTLRIKVIGLAPRTTYHYRFLVLRDDNIYSSVKGRTRTAPAADDDQPVKFAFWSCQDYEGRYYNSWQRLHQLDENLDFVLGLGDYIYEKVPKTAAGVRKVAFADQTGAIAVGNRLAAATLGQYRDLYKLYRSDPVLQRVHERYPMILIWDDHEYANDCFGASSTDQNGKTSELTPSRRRFAERAFFEYMPIDDLSAPSGTLAVTETRLYPSAKLFRDFRFGKHLHLLLTDYRSFRPDHLIPEEAYPGTPALNRLALQALGAYPVFAADDAFAVIDIDAPLYTRQKQVLVQAAIAGCLGAGLSQSEAEQRAAGWVTGELSLLYVNAVLKATMQTALLVPPARDMDRGVAWLHLGKQQLFSSVGSRYLIVKPLFDLYALYQWLVTAHESENVLGKDQQDWLQQTLTDSKTTFRVIGSSVMPTEGILNLTTIAGIPASFQQVFLYGIDGWDGFPNKRQELIDFLKQSGITNTFFVSGDIHGGFVSELGGDTAVSITTPAISSGTLQESVRDAALGLGFTIDSPGYKAVVANLEKTLRDSNPSISFSAPDQHGFVMVEVGPSSAKVTFHLINQSEVMMDSTGLAAAALAAKFTTQQFQIIGGTVTTL